MLLDGGNGEGTLRRVSKVVRVGSPRVIDCSGKFQVIPWKARSSRDSIERGLPLLSFCFTIRSIRPDYRIQARSTIPAPSQLWMLATYMRSFRVETNSGPYQWHNGLVQPIPSGEQPYWMQYSTTSMFWYEDCRGFLQVPYDCTKVDVSDALCTSERDIPPPWSGLTFRHTLGPDNRSLSLVGYAYEELVLDSLGSFGLDA